MTSVKEETKPKVTIITVCYQSEATIARTIRSVLEQDYDRIEYIVKDGGSGDRTNEIVESYGDKFRKKGIAFFHIVEKDRGIYHAMNEATAKCTGDWVLYLNSDDCFYSKDVISSNLKWLQDKETAVVYGDSVSVWKGKQKRLEHDHSQLTNGMSLCHQACFIRGDLIRAQLYQEKYRIGADYDFFLKLYLQGQKFQKSPHIFCLYSKEGLSSTDLVYSYQEFLEIRRANGLPNPGKAVILYRTWKRRILCALHLQRLL